ncbi:InlB B-repeat-containing protein [Paenibacillus sp. N3.4]|uniref:InlB B-repeat-containing protein n=1 Tax=Paenibacillus sp. N3.4 TaxID=2603222 RepID=UPI0011CA8DA9|nr:InlB B-repeat-containing protein [Paenibacillus sp. N3.4]TXK83999.1 hypothetical protein FU659_11180 [Paenibacillus sp. N3.4]
MIMKIMQSQYMARISVILVLSLLLSVFRADIAAAAALDTTPEVTVEVGSVIGEKGETVSVPVSIKQASAGISAYWIQIQYDKDFLDVVDVEGEAGESFLYKLYSNQGYINATWADMENGPIQTGGKLFTIKFAIKNNATPGDKPVTINAGHDQYSFLNEDLMDDDGNYIEFVKHHTNGKVTVNQKPIAAGVTISGTTKVGQTLTGGYTYSDAEGDAEGNSVYKWFRSNDAAGNGKSAIADATGKTYTLTTDDLDKYISFEVSPVAATGNLVGGRVESIPVGPVSNSYTVTFDSNNGSAAITQTVSHGGNATKPADPTKTGYTFGGWYKEAGLTNAWNFATDKVTAATTLYAKWTASEYTVSFNANGGSAVSDITASYDTTATEPSAPTKTGYLFGGWYKEAVLTNAWNFATDKVTAATTLYAKWTASEYTVTFDPNNGSTAFSQSVNHGGKATKPADPMKTGYTFKGWYTENDTAFDFNTAITGNVTVVAKWEAFSGDAYLVALSLSSGELTPGFAKEVTDYTTVVSHFVDQVSVTASVYDSHATLTINGKTATSGQATGPIGLIVGDNTITVLVTAQDDTTRLYTITVVREPEISPNAELDNLLLSHGTLTPGFSSDMTNYETRVGSGVSSMTVTALVYDTYATLKINGLATASGKASRPIALQAGRNVITVLVTAQDGVTNRSYTVIVTRESEPTTERPTETVIPEPESQSRFRVYVNGKTDEQIAVGTPVKENGKTVLEVNVDNAKLNNRLAHEGDKPVIIVPVMEPFDKVITALTGESVKALENKQAIVELQTPSGSYRLPAAEVAIESLSSKFGKEVKLTDIVVKIEIKKSDFAKVQLLEDVSNEGRFTVVVPPVDFTVTAAYNGETVHLDKFQIYVQREIPLPEGADPNKITTAIVLEQDGTVRHVPTYVTKRDGKAYAVVNSLTNSTYSLIWHPMTFADVELHWAKNAVNDMASRLVLNGVDEKSYRPDAPITRAELAAVIVRALGLSDRGQTAMFNDVKADDWYSGALVKAYEYGIIQGYEDGTFRPLNPITREETMVMMARAMKNVGLKKASGDTAQALSAFEDRQSVSVWAEQAAASLVTQQLVRGDEAGRLMPLSFISRAETAAIVQRMLIKANLIDNDQSQ